MNNLAVLALGITYRYIRLANGVEIELELGEYTKLANIFN